MTSRIPFSFLLFVALGVALSLPGHAQLPAPDATPTTAPATGTPAAAPAAPPVNPTQPAVDPNRAAIGEALQLLRQNKLDDAMAKVNAVIAANPKFVDAYLLRGNIYAQKLQWPEAGKEYETALSIDSTNTTAKFNLAESKFRQKQYDDARVLFASMQNDPNNGDLASYKVFLCDLFGGHQDVAAKELDAFNQVGSHASYYFANAAWDLVNKKTEDARGWLNSANNIYSPTKVVIYSVSLKDLGYLPLPPPPPPQ